ncbi:MAG: MATE family efflux transporter [Clostridia bacterium]
MKGNITRLRMKELSKYILPTVAGSICNFLYVIVDGIFVGQGVGGIALGAVNIACPFTLLISAIAMLTTVGGVTVAAIRIGRGDHDGANDAFMHAMCAAIVIGALMMIIGTTFSDGIAALCGANDTFIAMSSDYIFYCSMFSLPVVCSIILGGFVRCDGSPLLASIAVISGALANVFLDWLFVFPLNMGVAGAAIASGLGQVAAFAILLLHFLRRRGHLRVRKFKFRAALLGKVIIRGLPEMVAQFGTPIMTICLNYALLRHMGDLEISAFAVIAYITAFAIGVFLGVSGGLQPLIGRCYGARDAAGLHFYLRAGVVINVTCGVALYAVFVVFGRQLCGLFSSDAALIDAATAALPAFGWAFIIMAVNLVISSYFYSTKRTKEALVAALSRCVVLNSICILGLPMLFGGTVVWYTLGIAEAASLVISFLLLWRSERYGTEFI